LLSGSAESKFLRDAVLGIDREVDVVIEGEFDGGPVVVSIEVNERGRRAGLPWVQEKIYKHRTLPSNRLILVSRAGFTSPALDRSPPRRAGFRRSRLRLSCVTGSRS
jgi:hypothetical protein